MSTVASAAFASHAAHPDVAPRIVASLQRTWGRLAQSGTWWTGPQQIALADLARSAFAQRFVGPWMRDLDEVKAAAMAVEIAETAMTAMVTLVADARSVDRDWAARHVAVIGDGAYVELVAIAATIAAVDAFAEAVGLPTEALPVATAPEVEPSRIRPAGVGDIGAYVDMLNPFDGPNVARALTLCPAGSELYRDLGGVLYHDGQFLDLAWERVITRPQAELVATAVSAANECFY